jgi:plastocyanin
VTLKITASGIAFDTDTLEVPAGVPFKIEFTNNDAGIPHNVAIHEGSPTGPAVWTGEIFNGVETRTYDVPALPAGTYGFVCTVHPNMTGTLTAR